MSPNDLIGTASYILLAASYLVTNIYWLRLLAIVALTTEAIYFYLVGDQQLWVGILGRHLQPHQHRAAQHPHAGAPQGADVGGSAFAACQHLRPAGAGRFQPDPRRRPLHRRRRGHRAHAPGRTGRITAPDVERARPRAGGRSDDRRARRRRFHRRMAYIGGADASATVVTEIPCRTFRIAHAALHALCAKHPKIEAVMNARFSIDLAHKLRTRPLVDQAAADTESVQLHCVQAEAEFRNIFPAAAAGQRNRVEWARSLTLWVCSAHAAQRDSRVNAESTLRPCERARA